jgi:hypothetical protein
MRVIGIVPYDVAESGGVHVYAGRNARVVDCESGREIARGTSLRDVLVRLARIAACPVRLFDETLPGAPLVGQWTAHGTDALAPLPGLHLGADNYNNGGSK